MLKGHNMVKIDLITGFLGAGKTTFIRNYAEYLMGKGENIGILENDFGAVNVDMMLLQDLEGEHCELEMVSGGCDKDCHRRRFKTKLIAMGMCGYDRVLVEPSGVFDVDEFFDALREEPLDRWYQVGSVLTVVDAHLAPELSEEADYILASEVANAGKILLSKTEDACPEEIADTKVHLNRALEGVQCSRRLDPKKDIFGKKWEDLTDEEWKVISESGFHAESWRKLDLSEEEVFQSLYFMDQKTEVERAKTIAENLLKDPSCGKVHRVKGFLMDENGQWLELNATARELTVKPVAAGQDVIIVIGEKLDKEKISSFFENTVVVHKNS